MQLLGESTMLQAIINSLNQLDVVAPVIICNEGHRFIVAEKLRNIYQKALRGLSI
jgi:mannose-1-phosphate guanylyltransferase